MKSRERTIDMRSKKETDCLQEEMWDGMQEWQQVEWVCSREEKEYNVE